jgi:hypothetical protein
MPTTNPDRAAGCPSRKLVAVDILDICDGHVAGFARSICDTAGMLSVSELRAQSRQSAYLFALFFLHRGRPFAFVFSFHAHSIGPPLNLSRFCPPGQQVRSSEA